MGREDRSPVSGCIGLAGKSSSLAKGKIRVSSHFPVRGGGGGGGEVWADEPSHTVEGLRVCTRILNVSSNGETKSKYSSLTVS